MHPDCLDRPRGRSPTAWTVVQRWCPGQRERLGNYNRAAGGTLYQDIYTQISDRPILRHTRTAANLHPRHEIEIVRNSIIHNSFHTDRVWVNSYHHQAVKTLAPGFRVTSRASDGIIESIEHSDRKFAVGIQWHPERLWAIESIYQNIFIEFVRCCENAQ